MGISATRPATRAATAHEIFTQARHALQRMVQSGTTTVEIKSGYGLDIETELKQLSVVRPLMDAIPVDIVATYLGAHAVPKCESAESYVEFLCREALPAVARQGIAAFCDVFCETGVFTAEQSERVLCAGQKLGLRSKIHADELTDTGGAALAAKVGAISADHLHCANEEGLRAMAAAGTVAVLLPGTAIFLGLSHHAPARRMIELGIPISIATDFNPGSCFCESLPLIMTFACTQLGLSPAEALTAVTINAACAIGMDGVIGSLTPGKQADFVIWDADNYHMIPYHMGANLVRTVIKRGQIIHGRTH
jgi:imidazolonepropionase